MIDVIVNDNKKYSTPESFDELTREQLIAIAPILLKGNPTPQEKWYVAMQLCGFGDDLYSAQASRKKNGYEYISQEIMTRVQPHIEFVFEKTGLVKQLITVVDVAPKYQFFGTRRLYGPQSEFNNLTIAEFSDTESCLNYFETTKDPVWLHRFIAVLYRPGKKSLRFTGDHRLPYNFHMNDFIAEMVSKIDERIKCAILLWYHACRAQLVTDYGFLFSKKNDGEGGSWTDIIHDLAGPKFGNIDETGRTNLKVVFTELRLMHQKAHAA